MENVSISHLWNLLLTGLFGVMWYFIRGKFDEMVALRVKIEATDAALRAKIESVDGKLSMTREEVASSTISRAEFREGLDSVMKRLDELSAQLINVLHSHNR